MQSKHECKFPNIDLSSIKTPAFIVDLETLEKNLKILRDIEKKAGCKILLALKAFSMYSTFNIMRNYLCGVCASGLNEARLGYEEFGKEVHTYCPAFSDDEFSQIIKYSDHIIFNSINQLEHFLPAIEKSKKKIHVGLRVNPEVSAKGVKYHVYNAATRSSRLGVIADNLKGKDLNGITGIHFHALCEQGADALEEVLDAFEKKFGDLIKKMSWINFGGGHLITADDYDREKLVRLITEFKKRHPNIKEVYLEPGEAHALNAGILAATVLDIVHNDNDMAILDVSTECHLPDVMFTRHEPKPYLPQALGAKIGSKEGDFKYSYTLGGVSCAAGDVIAEYSFEKKLDVGDKIVFLDAAIYSMVKTSTFNGVNLPSINVYKDGKIKAIKKFGYKDFKERL